MRMKPIVIENLIWLNFFLPLRGGQLQNRSSLCFVRSKSQWKENTWTFTQRKRRRFATRYVLSRRKRIRTMPDAPCEATGNTQNRAQRLHTAPMEMTAKNGEYCTFETLEKHKIRAKMGDLGVKKLPRLRENSASIDHQSNLDCTAM